MTAATPARLFALLLFAASSELAYGKDPESILDRLRPPLVAAHRGGEFGLPNSLAQFASDIEAGDADIIELDLRLTKDGQVVVFHDDTLDHRSDCTGTVESKRYIDLMQCKLSDGERIPLFEDVLELIDGRLMISAEPKTDEAVVPTAQLVLGEGAENWVYFETIGSEHRYRLLRSVSPDLAAMAKIDSPQSWQWVMAANDPYLRIVELDRDYANPTVIADIHRHGKLATMNAWRYQFSEERFAASCDRVFGQGIDIAVTNNAHSCRGQESAWTTRVYDHGFALDRQHIRRWAREHPIEKRLTPVVPLLLLAYLGFLRRWMNARQRRRESKLQALARSG
jgi:glycerophosphoryl diester phosphodiesterase